MFRSENEGRKPRNHVLKEAVLELKGGEPLLVGFCRPGGMKFSPTFLSVPTSFFNISRIKNGKSETRMYLHAYYTCPTHNRY